MVDSAGDFFMCPDRMGPLPELERVICCSTWASELELGFLELMSLWLANKGWGWGADLQGPSWPGGTNELGSLQY